MRKAKATYGSTLRELRRHSNLTQGDLAVHLDVTVAYISAVERGKRPAFSLERTSDLEMLLGSSDALRKLAVIPTLPCGCFCTCIIG